MADRPVQAAGLGRDVVVATGGVVATKIFAAAGGVLSARLLGPSGKGELAVAMLVGNALGIAGTVGLEFWTAREVATSAERWPVVLRVWGRHLRVTAAATAVLAVLGALSIATWNPKLALIGLPTLVFAATTIVSMLHLSVLGGLRRMRRVAAATTLAGAVYPAGLAAMLALGLDSVPLAVLVAAAATAILALAAGRPNRHLSGPAGPGTRLWSAQAYRRALGFGAPAAVGELLALAVARIDLVLLAAFRDSAAVGRYAVASSLTEMLWIVPNGVSQVLLPHIAARPSREDTAALVRMSVAVMLAAGVVLVAFGSPLITELFGPRFRDATRVLPALVLAAAALGIWKVLLADVIARGDSRARAATAFTGLIAMVSTDLVLIPRYGIVGAGVGSFIGYSVAAVHVSRRWRRRSGGGRWDLVLLRRADVALLVTTWRSWST